MADAPYLIALALLEQQGERAMPLQGKSLPAAIAAGGDPGEVGRQQALELLLRIWQRSDQGALRRAGGAHSLLLITVPIEALQEQVPALKARWLYCGDTAALLDDLHRIAEAVWSLELEPRQPLRYRRLH